MSASSGKQHGFSPMRGNWKAVTSGSGRHEMKRPTCRLRSREEIDCVSTPPLLGEKEVLRIELEIRRVLLPPAEQIGSPVLDPPGDELPGG